MSVLGWIIAFSVFGSLLSVGMAAGYLLLPERARTRSLDGLVSFATGVLLGVAFIHLLPHALDHEAALDSSTIMVTVLLGIFVFFILEKALIWRHAHHHGHDASDEHRGAKSAGALIVVGDTFHNFLDGILLTAAFVTDVHLGIATGFALIAHEIPQELGDFAILINSGMSRTRAFILNGVTSLAMAIGALVAWWGIKYVQATLPYILAFTAASFIYIAVADLIPSLHRGVRLKDTITQLILITAGILLITAFQTAEIV
jgi:zinc and cadmium transporter